MLDHFADIGVRRVEGLVQRGVKVLMMVVRDRDFRAGHLDVQPHHEFLALVLVARGNFNHHAATDDLAMVAVELFGMLADRRLDGLGFGDVAQGDLQRNLHVQ